MKHYVGYLDNPNRRVEVDAVNYIAAIVHAMSYGPNGTS
jgi:hypothetical protein